MPITGRPLYVLYRLLRTELDSRKCEGCNGERGPVTTVMPEGRVYCTPCAAGARRRTKEWLQEQDLGKYRTALERWVDDVLQGKEGGATDDQDDD